MLPSSPGDSMPAAIRMTSLTGRMAARPAKHTFLRKINVLQDSLFAKIRYQE